MKNDMLDALRFKRATFRALHKQGCFVLPNPWDVGGIRRLEKLGFKALASTSAGAAWALGRNDGELSLDEVLEHLRLLCAPTDLPVNADFEAGFADETEGVATNVTLALDTGIAGLSVEDRTDTLSTSNRSRRIGSRLPTKLSRAQATMSCWLAVLRVISSGGRS